ncbi:autotransporter family protein [Endozoicomonas numazuensis]|uniref:Autotransporter domain-containing protein n=1 Tax=Endozoicomonas numazuensis TaxID=1137799 RepID=A0A081NFI4_9GAMM|nr:autotransporter outer membrane beta-barrel domain-containing protein [Endozoicomonas numazuensis]KEQ17207.1 hypothetical protein GZ78_15335 [Endozoicomonas numazuensis]
MFDSTGKEIPFQRTSLSRAIFTVCCLGFYASTASPKIAAAEVCVATELNVISTDLSSDSCLIGTGGSVQVNSGGMIETIKVDGQTEGGVTNNGTVKSIDIGSSAQIKGGITNSGTLGDLEGNNFSIAEGSCINGIHNTADGVIQGTSVNIFDTTIDSHPSLDNEIAIQNDGRISGRNGNGNESSLNIYGSTINGDIVNESEGSIEGDKGIVIGLEVEFNGALINKGEISAESIDKGIGIHSEVRDGVMNKGIIRGDVVFFEDSGSSYFENSGVVYGSIWMISSESSLSIKGGGVEGFIVSGNGVDVSIDSEMNVANYQGGFEGVLSFQIAPLGQMSFSNTDSFSMEESRFVEAATNKRIQNKGTINIAANADATIIGDYSQSGDGQIMIQAESASNYGRLTIDGTADLSQNNVIGLTITSDDNFRNGDVLENVLSATNLIVGDELTLIDNSALLDFRAVADTETNTVDILTSQRSLLPLLHEGGSHIELIQGLGAHLENHLNQSDLHDSIERVTGELLSLGSAEEVADAVEQMGPLLSGSTILSSSASKQGLGAIVNQRILNSSGVTSFSGYNAVQSLDSKNTVTPAKSFDVYGVANSHSLWIAPYGQKSEYKQQGEISGYETSTSGMAFGIETQWRPNIKVGIAFSHSTGEVVGKDSLNRHEADITSDQIQGYGSWKLSDKNGLHGRITYGKNKMKGSRNIQFGSINETAKSDYEGWFANISATLSHKYKVSKDWNLTANAEMSYGHARDDGYEETGAGGSNLDVRSLSTKSMNIGLNGQLDRTIELEKKQLHFSFYGGLTTNLAGDQPQLRASLVNSDLPDFTTEGLKPHKVTWSTGVALLLTGESSWQGRIGYGLRGHKDYNSQAWFMKITRRF